MFLKFISNQEYVCTLFGGLVQFYISEIGSGWSPIPDNCDLGTLNISLLLRRCFEKSFSGGYFVLISRNDVVDSVHFEQLTFVEHDSSSIIHLIVKFITSVDECLLVLHIVDVRFSEGI